MTYSGDRGDLSVNARASAQGAHASARTTSAVVMSRALTTALVVLALAWAPWADARAFADKSPRSPEYVIKAAYLYNFAMFVEWPNDAFATADSPLSIGVVGD